MKLPLAYYGDPVLRKKTERVDEIDDELRQFVHDMFETMEVENGIGLAAPQVHRSISLFVTHVPIQQPDGKWIEGEYRVYINPKILEVGDELVEVTEGCLSIPKIQGTFLRPNYVKVEATDLEGNRFTRELTGLMAQNFCHENDHLNGVLYIDRMKGKARQEIEPYLREIKKKYSRP